MEKTPPTGLEELGQVELLRRQLADARKQLRESAVATAEESAIIKTLHELIPGRPEVPPARLAKLGKGVIRAAGILDIGDTHYGEKVLAKSTGGVAEYNPQIAESRLAYVTDEAIRLGHEENIQSMWLILGGDMISGNIHDDLERSNEVMPIEQTLNMADIVYSQIEKLCQAFPEVNVLGVSGNHARLYRPFYYNRKQIESLDYVLYKMLEAKGQNQKNLKFHTPESFWKIIDVADRKFLVMHGDTIKQQNSMSLPWYGMWKEFMKWKNMQDTVGDWDDMILHHFHIPNAVGMGNDMLYVNGATKGKDDFSLAGTRLPAPAAHRFLTVAEGKVLADRIINLEGR